MTEANQVDLFQMFRSIGALKEGHFLLASGRHSNRYIEKFDLLRNPTATEKVCRGFVSHFARERIDLVVGPTTGGIILAFEVGRQLRVGCAFAERKFEGASGREFRRGTSFMPGQRILLVDDILTTGGSIRETLTALGNYPVEVVGIGVLVDRSGGATEFEGIPLHALATIDIETWQADDCPLCAAGSKVVKPGTTAPA
jgi:orotate phosphoribosyltransferase